MDIPNTDLVSQGASVQLLLYGATIISWKVDTVERLFVSSKAALDGAKPVRGGIPIIFPCFGPPIHPDHARLTQHGFARSEVWTFDSVILDNDAGVSVKLSMLNRLSLLPPRELIILQL